MSGEKNRQSQANNELGKNGTKRKQHCVHDRLAKNRVLKDTYVVAKANKWPAAGDFSLQIVAFETDTETIIEWITEKEQQVEDSRNQESETNQVLAILRGPGTLGNLLLLLCQYVHLLCMRSHDTSP